MTNGEIYADEGVDNLEGIAPIADIDYARATWVGKTFWYKLNYYELYDASTDKFKKFDLKKYSPVKVIDSVAGWYNDTPVALVLQAKSGETWTKSINVSGTNSSFVYKDICKFNDYFLTEDPRLKYKWPEKVWSAIEKGSLLMGMTPEQVRMSWGEPKEINNTITGNAVREQWVYLGGSYLYFTNGKLKSVQN